MTAALPHRRPDLLVRPLDGGGRYVVKDPNSGAYFQLGEQEYFLVSQLDENLTPAEVCEAFEEKFGEPLNEKELEGFLDLATEQGFVPLAEETPPPSVGPIVSTKSSTSMTSPVSAPSAAPARGRTWSVLYWRASLFDPNRLFNLVAPRIWFLC